MLTGAIVAHLIAQTRIMPVGFRLDRPTFGTKMTRRVDCDTRSQVRRYDKHTLLTEAIKALNFSYLCQRDEV